MRLDFKPIFGIYCLLLFTLMATAVLLISLFLPALRSRRAVARHASRLFLRAIRVPLRVRGLKMLPSTACVVVANHSSYLDGLVLAAALPPDFGFVIKKEMVRVPVASVLLRRLGSEFVERFNRHQGAADTRRVLKTAAAGQSLVFFPEGTFNRERGIGPFHGGAFATAARNALPLVAIAIRGTREALPSGTLLIRRHPIDVEILAVLPTVPARNGAAELRQECRTLIASALGEEMLSN
jgi:1-acyl-sn-glycerol-3-phosphate acyltransferase